MGFLCLQLFELVYCLFLPSANIKVPIPIVELVLVYTIPYIILSSVSSVLYNLLNYYLHLKYENVTRFQENISLSYLLAARIKISYFAPVPFFIYDIVSVLFTFYYLLSFFRWFFNNLQTKGFVVRRCKCLKKKSFIPFIQTCSLHGLLVQILFTLKKIKTSKEKDRKNQNQKNVSKKKRYRELML